MIFATLEALRRRLARNPRDTIFRYTPRRCACAEIGVWQGDFSERILARARPEKLFLIDPWRYVPTPPHNRGLYGDRTGQEGMNAVAEGVERRFGGMPNVEILRMDSLAAAERFAEGQLGWAYIDGDHTFDACLADLRAWWPKVRTCLCGDDYGNDHRWWGDGVSRAVDTFIAETGCRHFVAANQFVLFRD